MNPDELASIIDNGTKDLGILGQLILSYSAPKNITKKAQAEVDSYYIKISALTGLSKNEIISMTRNNTFELLKSVECNNIKDILCLANDINLIDTEKIKNTNKDWLHKFINYASFISDKDVQILWARILAGEINKHGSFSLQTMNILSMIDKTLAKKIGDLFNHCCTINNKLGIFYFSDDNENNTLVNIDNDLLIEFESLGFIKQYFDFAACYFWFDNDNDCILKYGTHEIVLKPKKDPKNKFYIILGKLEITKIGKELYSLYDQDVNEDIFLSIKNNLIKHKYKILSKKSNL